MNDREVFKQVDGKWVSLGVHSALKAYQLRDQLRRAGFKVRTKEMPNYYMGLRSIFQ